MASFELRWRNSTARDIRRIPRREIERIISAAEQLAENPLPHGSQKLSGSERTYRIRVGDYRILYEVWSEARIVQIERIRHRKDAYRE